jgi:hypothetical protein
VYAALAAALLWASAACDDQGSVAIACSAGSVLCGTQCSNLQGDPANCGMCGNVCAHGTICDLGNCTGAGFDAGIAVDGSKPPGDAGHDGASDGGEGGSDGGGDSASSGDGASDGAGDGPNDSATMEGGGPG